MKVINREKKERKGLLPAYESLKPSQYKTKSAVTRGTKAQRSGRGFTITEPK